MISYSPNIKYQLGFERISDHFRLSAEMCCYKKGTILFFRKKNGKALISHLLIVLAKHLVNTIRNHCMKKEKKNVKCKF